MGMRPRFNVGDRVRVRIAKDVIKEKDILCDVGYVQNVAVRFKGTKFEKIIYTVRLDGVYCGFIGVFVTVSEGFNVNSKLYSLEKEFL